MKKYEVNEWGEALIRLGQWDGMGMDFIFEKDGMKGGLCTHKKGVGQGHVRIIKL